MRLQIRVSLTAGVALTCALGFCVGQTVHKEAPFSYQLPKGWKAQEVPGLKFKAAVGPPSNGFAPNMNIVDERFPGSAAEYAKHAEKTMEALPGYKKLGGGAFVTRSGIKGWRLLGQHLMNGVPLRMWSYCFPNGEGMMFVVTCTALASEKAKWDGTFQTSMKSFAFK